MWRRADNWGYSRRLMFQLGNDPQELLHSARMMTSLLSFVLGALVFVWAQELFGTAGGFVSLLLFAFNPTVLAHGSAATIDLAAALAFTAAAWTLWRVLHRLTAMRLGVSGLVWGLALTAKFSTLLLVPIAVLLVAIRIAGARPWIIELTEPRKEVTARGAMLPYVALVAFVHGAAALLVIWLMFGFRFEMHRRLADGSLDPAAQYSSDWIPRAGRLAPLIGFFHSWRLLPEAFLFGLCETMRAVAGFNAFLNGRFGVFGFPSFFPYCVLYKTPLGVFLVGASGVVAYGARCVHGIRALGSRPLGMIARAVYATAPLWCIAIVYGYTAIAGTINIGIRHILPVFPPAFILMGAAGRWLQVPERSAAGGVAFPPRKTAGVDPPDDGTASWLPLSVRAGAAGLVVICLAWFVADVAAAYPNYLAYFNALGGGSRNGYKHLVDSSFDWGQELPALKTWLDQVNASSDRPASIYFSYFGSTPPSVYGIRAKMLPSYFDLGMLEPGMQQPFEAQLSPGVYVISATMVQSVYNPVAPGPWRKDYEQWYQQLRGTTQMFLQADGPGRQQLIERSGPERWARGFSDYEGLRFARLCAYLRRREPAATINHGVLVYTLTRADLLTALSGPPVEAYDPPATPDGNVPY